MTSSRASDLLSDLLSHLLSDVYSILFVYIRLLFAAIFFSQRETFFHRFADREEREAFYFYYRTLGRKVTP